MFTLNKLSKRYSLLITFVLWFLITSQIVRIIFFAWQYNEASLNVFTFLGTLLTGLFFDVGTISFIVFPSIVYYFLFPNKWIGSWIDKIIVWFFTTLVTFILVFTFFAEITFWDEFKTRFNFIAVDYLIYTHEVVKNIQQSYPLPLLIIGVSLTVFLVLFLFHKRNAFKNTFSHPVTLKQKGIVLVSGLISCLFFTLFITNNHAEWSTNRYNAEISKSGIYSFFSALRNNQLVYNEFYTTINEKEAFSIVRNKLEENNTKFQSNGLSIHRKVFNTSNSEPFKKNVVIILVESLSASFMKEFGNEKNITPF